MLPNLATEIIILQVNEIVEPEIRGPLCCIPQSMNDFRLVECCRIEDILHNFWSEINAKVKCFSSLSVVVACLFNDYIGIKKECNDHSNYFVSTPAPGNSL